MRKLLLMVGIVAFAVSLNAQVLQSINFDNYTAGSNVAVSDSNFTTWSNLPGSSEDALISSVQASSGTNSMMISKDNDCVWILGDSTSGKYELSFKVYVPADSVAYFNVLHKFAGGSSEWSNECYILPSDSLFHLFVGGNDTAQTAFTFDTWHTLMYTIDLDYDFVFMMMDNDTLFSWPYSIDGSGNNSLTQIGAMDFYGYDLYSAGNVRLYLDDFKFEKIINVGMNEASQKSIKMYPNPAQNQIRLQTIKPLKSTKILNANGSIVMENKANTKDLNLDVSHLAPGLYYVQMNFGSSIAIRKLIIQ